MTQDAMITWYYNQRYKDGGSYDNNLSNKDIKILMSMWHNQESENKSTAFSEELIESLKQTNSPELIEKYRKLGLFR